MIFSRTYNNYDNYASIIFKIIHKKGWFKGDRSANLADHKIDKNILSPFNVIEKLEKLFDMSADILLIKN